MTDLTNTVRTVQSLPEPEVLGLAGELALDDGRVGGGEGAGGPGQGGLHGGDQVEEAPGDDDVVVTANYSRHHTATVAHTSQAGVNLTETENEIFRKYLFLFSFSDLLPGPGSSHSELLPQPQLQQHEWHSHQDQHQQERQDEGTWTW